MTIVCLLRITTVLPAEVLSFMVMLLGCLVVSPGFIMYCQCVGCGRKMCVGSSCLSCVETRNLDSFNLVSCVSYSVLRLCTDCVLCFLHRGSTIALLAGVLNTGGHSGLQFGSCEVCSLSRVCLYSRIIVP